MTDTIADEPGRRLVASLQAETRREMARLDALYGEDDKGSPYYVSIVAAYGRFVPENVARHILKEHGTRATMAQDEVLEECFWGSPTPQGVGTTVHVGSLLSVLGY